MWIATWKSFALAVWSAIRRIVIRSAAELADDLQNWLDDRPIVARPAGLWRRSRRWVRHNRSVAAAAGGLLSCERRVGRLAISRSKNSGRPAGKRAGGAIGCDFAVLRSRYGFSRSNRNESICGQVTRGSRFPGAFASRYPGARFGRQPRADCRADQRRRREAGCGPSLPAPCGS